MNVNVNVCVCVGGIVRVRLCKNYNSMVFVKVEINGVLSETYSDSFDIIPGSSC